MVERNLAKVEVAGPSPVFRSREVIRNDGLFSYVSRLCRDIFVYISELGGSNEAVMPFRPFSGLEAESLVPADLQIRRNRGRHVWQMKLLGRELFV